MNSRFLVRVSCASILGVALGHSATRVASAAPTVIRLAEATDDKVDLNSATEQQLADLPGLDVESAKRIIEHRPYESARDLGKAEISAREIVIIAPLVTAKPIPAKGAKKGTTRPADK